MSDDIDPVSSQAARALLGLLKERRVLPGEDVPADELRSGDVIQRQDVPNTTTYYEVLRVVPGRRPNTVDVVVRSIEDQTEDRWARFPTVTEVVVVRGPA